jgi:PEP-CTERM motif
MRLSLSIFALLGILISRGVAATFITLPTSYTSAASGLPVVMIGHQFFVENAPILVSHLGIYDYQQNGLANASIVTIWDSNGITVATVPFAAGAPGTLDGDYRYIALPSPLAVTPEVFYTIGATIGSSDPAPVGGPMIIDPEVTLGTPVSSLSSNLYSAANPIGIQAYGMANFKFISTVPEPGSVILLLAGTAGALLRRRRV